MIDIVVNEIKSFLDDNGRLISYPAKRKRQIYALFYLASKFETGKRYTEKEVNEILNKWHTFNDWATVTIIYLSWSLNTMRI